MEANVLSNSGGLVIKVGQDEQEISKLRHCFSGRHELSFRG